MDFGTDQGGQGEAREAYFSTATEGSPKANAELVQKAPQGASVKQESAQDGCLGTSRR